MRSDVSTGGGTYGKAPGMTFVPAQRRCVATVNRSRRGIDLALARGGEAAVARLLRHHGRCRCWALPDSPFCQAHALRRLGTGPMTNTGRERSHAARRAGHARWIEERRSAGLPARTRGRGRGTPNKTPEQRAWEAAQKEDKRIARERRLQRNADKRARREAKRREREELAELEHRRQAFHRGMPFWSDAAAPPPKPPRRMPLDWATAPAQLDDQDSVFDLLEANLALLREHGIRACKADIADWTRIERAFIENLGKDAFPRETIERAIKLFRQYESFYDRGEAADRRRRERLEGAYEEWRERRTRELTARIVAGRDARAAQRAAAPVDERAKRHSIAPWIK
jgi:hypothetical protein